MQGERLRIGIIGSGYAASFHAEAYKKVTAVKAELAGIYSPTPEHRTAFASRHDIPRTFDSLSAMLESPDIDVVDICTPNSNHAALAVAAAKAGKHIVVEKVLTGYFGQGEAEVGATPRSTMLEQVIQSVHEVNTAVRQAGVRLGYAENWVYAPSIQKADRLLAQSGGTILRLVGEESHSGSHSPFAKEWRTAGGGSLVNKGSHPLGGILHLKYQEGLRKADQPIRPRRVMAHVNNLTRIPSFAAETGKWIKTGWQDVEDWGIILIEFTDGSVAQVTGADTVLGGILNKLTVFGSKAVVECNLNPNDTMLAYSPDAGIFGDEYLREKVETTAGWQFISPDEAWAQGYYAEMDDFCASIVAGRDPISSLTLAGDVAIVLYAAYLAAEQGSWVDVTPYLATEAPAGE